MKTDARGRPTYNSAIRTCQIHIEWLVREFGHDALVSELAMLGVSLRTDWESRTPLGRAALVRNACYDLVGIYLEMWETRIAGLPYGVRDTRVEEAMA